MQEGVPAAVQGGLGSARQQRAEDAERAMLLGPPAGAEGRRKRIEAVVETLATLRGESESLRGLAHDARNMVTALSLYCDLLEEPGVLQPAYRHYGSELRLLSSASRRLVERMMALDAKQSAQQFAAGPAAYSGAATKAPQIRTERVDNWDLVPALPIQNLAADLLANRNLLAALAGSSITLNVKVEESGKGVRLTSEDLTRILVNLVKNSAEAMPNGGRIQIELKEIPEGQIPAGPGGSLNAAPVLLLSIEDNGPGIPAESREWVFESGYTTHARSSRSQRAHRGLGLAITRSIVEAAGGRIHATDGAAGGARIEIELPSRAR